MVNGELLNIDSLTLRKRIAREAAHLIYYGIEKEYKQAKLKAALTFHSKFLPTNLEVAIELDKITEETEGTARQQHLIQMRKEASKLMQTLKQYKPLLVGSVWRGTVHHDSDIDIVAHHDEPMEIVDLLKRSNLRIIQTEKATITERGKRKVSFHIYVELPIREKAEIKVVPSSEVSLKERCDIYGDEIVGLSILELENILRENPTRRFVPF